MKFAALAAVLLLAAPTGAGAQDGGAGQTPEPLARRDLVSLGAWYEANVTSGPEWRLRSYRADGIVMVGRALHEDATSGHVVARIRYESTAPVTVGEVVWRSAMVIGDADCRGLIAVMVAQPNVPKTSPLYQPSIVANPQPTTQSLVLYSGQNITGRAILGTPALAATLTARIDAALKDICDLTTAERLDSRNDTTTAPMLRRDSASVEAWAKSTLDTKGWGRPVYTDSSVSFLSDESRLNGRKGKFSIRVELIDPTLGKSITLAPQATRDLPGVFGAIRPYIRPVWIRSQQRDYDVDCTAMTARQTRFEIFVDHNLRTSADRGANPPNAIPIDDMLIDSARLRAWCAGL